MPNFASSKTRCGASRPANTPRQACSLDCITKLRFAFQPAPAGKTVRPDISRQPANSFTVTSGQRLSGLILYRALHFTVITASLPAPAGQQLFGAYLLQPGLHRKTSFCFSASTCRQDSHTIHFAPAGNGLSPTAGRHLSGRFFTEHHTFRPQLPPARRQPANNLSPHIFSY